MHQFRDILDTSHESPHLEKSSPSITEPGKSFTFRKLLAYQYSVRNDATIEDSVGELSTTCCQLVKVASILNQYWTSWQHVVLKPVQAQFANSIILACSITMYVSPELAYSLLNISSHCSGLSYQAIELCQRLLLSEQGLVEIYPI